MFVLQECHEECSDIYDPVCGTDHQTYSNECNLKLQICQTRNKNLTLAYSGECIGNWIKRIRCIHWNKTSAKNQKWNLNS